MIWQGFWQESGKELGIATEISIELAIFDRMHNSGCKVLHHTQRSIDITGDY
ncbi:MAG: hypothetical protein ACRC62_38260 [Microcoleus sp.]